MSRHQTYQSRVFLSRASSLDQDSNSDSTEGNLQMSHSIKSQIICTYHLRGKCIFGDKCFKLHMEQEQPEKRPENKRVTKRSELPPRFAKQKKGYIQERSLHSSPSHVPHGKEENPNDEQLTNNNDGLLKNTYNEDLLKNTYNDGLPKNTYMGHNPKNNFKAQKPTNTLNSDEPTNTPKGAEIRNTFDEEEKVVCYYYSKGMCAFGKKCFKLHLEPDQLEARVRASRAQAELAPDPASDPKKNVPKLTKAELDSLMFGTPLPEPEIPEPVMVEIEDDEKSEDDRPKYEYVTIVEEEERKLTKREKKRQERLLETLVKKEKKKEEVYSRLRNKIIEAFTLFRKKKIDESFLLFQDLLSLATLPSSAYRTEALVGRMRCHRSKKKFHSALQDLQQVLSNLDESMKFVVITLDDIYGEEVEIWILYGDVKSAKAALLKMSALSTSLQDKIQYYESCISKAESFMSPSQQQQLRHLSIEEFEDLLNKALEEVKLAEDIAPESAKVAVLRAECFVRLQKFADARKIISKVSENPELDSSTRNSLKAIKAIMSYYSLEWKDFGSGELTNSDEFKEMHTAVQEIARFQIRWRLFELRLQTMTRVEAYVTGLQDRDKLDYCMKFLDFDTSNRPFTSRLHFLIADHLMGNKTITTMKSKSSLTLNRIRDFFEVSIRLNPTHNALYERGRFFALTDEFDKAKSDLKRAQGMAPWNNKIKRLLEKLNDFEKRKREGLDESLYQVLGVESNSSPDDIRKAFKLKAKEFHPDKHPNANNAQKKKLEAKMKQINRAHHILSDSGKRQMYDSIIAKSSEDDFFQSDSDSDDDYEHDCDSCDSDDQELNAFNFFKFMSMFSKFRL